MRVTTEDLRRFLGADEDFRFESGGFPFKYDGDCFLEDFGCCPPSHFLLDEPLKELPPGDYFFPWAGSQLAASANASVCRDLALWRLEHGLCYATEEQAALRGGELFLGKKALRYKDFVALFGSDRFCCNGQEVDLRDVFNGNVPISQVLDVDIEEPPFSPEHGELYYTPFIGPLKTNAHSNFDAASILDRWRRDNGLCFRTEEGAKAWLERALKGGGRI